MVLVLQVSLLMAFIVVVLPAFFPRRHLGGRRIQCTSNIRQIGLGILGYADNEGCFPPGTIPNDHPSLDCRLGWGASILPYIDMFEYLCEKGVSDKVAVGCAWDDPIFADLIKDPPGIIRCPEPPRGPSYAAIAGLGTDAPSLQVGHRRAGIFGDTRRVTPADVKDGTSTTMMIAESATVPGPWFAGGRATVRGLDPLRRPYLGPARQFGGRHRGGANVLFADGSARFVRESIDPKVFEAISTMAGGEKISGDWDD